MYYYTFVINGIKMDYQSKYEYTEDDVSRFIEEGINEHGDKYGHFSPHDVMNYLAIRYGITKVPYKNSLFTIYLDKPSS